MVINCRRSSTQVVVALFTSQGERADQVTDILQVSEGPLDPSSLSTWGECSLCPESDGFLPHSGSSLRTWPPLGLVLGETFFRELPGELLLFFN